MCWTLIVGSSSSKETFFPKNGRGVRAAKSSRESWPSLATPMLSSIEGFLFEREREALRRLVSTVQRIDRERERELQDFLVS